MRVYISYFFCVKDMPQTMVPVSAVTWDPEWYHDNKAPDHRFIDKRGVINGLKIKELQAANLPPEDNCDFYCDKKDPLNCHFKVKYREYLSTLKFADVWKRLTTLSENAKNLLKLSANPDICILVLEKPGIPCSEREEIVQWFKRNGVQVQEFDANTFKKGKKK